MAFGHTIATRIPVIFTHENMALRITKQLCVYLILHCGRIYSIIDISYHPADASPIHS